MSDLIVMHDVEVALNPSKTVRVKPIVDPEGDLRYLFIVHHDGEDYKTSFSEEQLLSLIMRNQHAREVYLESLITGGKSPRGKAISTTTATSSSGSTTTATSEAT